MCFIHMRLWFITGFFLWQIQANDLDTACEVLAQNFRITQEGVLDSKEIMVDPTKIKKHKPNDVTDHAARPLTHKYTCPSNKFYITSMDSDILSTQALTIMGECRATFSRKLFHSTYSSMKGIQHSKAADIIINDLAYTSSNIIHSNQSKLRNTPLY